MAGPRLRNVRGRAVRRTINRPLLDSLATITVTPEQEDIAIRGNALASGDEEEDAAEEARILSELENGNPWAWCCVKVTAAYAGLEATTYLGACSYRDEEDFRQGGYFDDMRLEVLDMLESAVEKTANDIARVAEERQ